MADTEDFDSLLALLERTTDKDGWLQPLLDDPDSAAVLGSYIQMFARLGISIPHNIAQGTLSDASGGSPGTASITVKRASGTTTGTIPAGYIFVDQRGCRAILQVAVVVTTQTQLVLPVQTLRQTELVNTEDDPGFTVDPASPPLASSGAGGVLIAPTAVVMFIVTTPGAIGTMKFTWAINNFPPSDPVASAGVTFAFAVPGTLIAVLFAAGTYDLGDTFTVNADGSVTFVGNGSGSVSQTAGVDGTTFEVASNTQILGGAADYLSVHGGERGTLRQPGEQTDAYRARIRNIPDAVGPVAVAVTVQQAAQALGLPPFLVEEPFEDGATPALKAHYGLSSFEGMFCDGDFCDDPEGPELVDRRTATAYLRVQAQDYVSDPKGYVMFCDDGFCDDPVLGFPSEFDTPPPQALAALLALVQDIAQKKSGGVNFDVFLLGSTLQIGEGSSSSASPTVVFTLTPPAGKIWYVNEAFAGHDCATPSSAPNVSHFLTYSLEGGGTLITPAYTRSDTQRAPKPTVRVTQITGSVTSDGTGAGNLVAWFWVLEVDL